jgi:hypothetical protein
MCKLREPMATHRHPLAIAMHPDFSRRCRTPLAMMQTNLPDPGTEPRRAGGEPNQRTDLLVGAEAALAVRPVVDLDCPAGAALRPGKA